MSDHDKHDSDDPAKPASGGGGLTRRELFQGLGVGAVAVGVGAAVTRKAHGAALPPGIEILGPGAIPLTLRINGQARALKVEPRATLLDVLRDELGLTGAKPSCERGACGACTVHLDGKPITSCMLLAIDAAGHEVTTIEGLARGDALAPIQAAFVEHDALQCGFCTPGMIMSCQAVLAAHPQPTADDVKRGVAGNLCRCGTYPRVVEATLAAAGAPRPGGGR